MKPAKRQTLATCTQCKASVPRIYQRGLCRDCIIREVQSLRPVINHYRAPEHFAPKGAA
jgi:predicted amidophosphoribosyltransferase